MTATTETKFGDLLRSDIDAMCEELRMDPTVINCNTQTPVGERPAGLYIEADSAKQYGDAMAILASLIGPQIISELAWRQSVLDPREARKVRSYGGQYGGESAIEAFLPGWRIVSDQPTSVPSVPAQITKED